MYVDTHVLLMPGTNPVWWKDCRQSLAEEPVRLHLIKGVKGHVGAGRIEGFRQGESPFVSCVDPDDLVIPGAFAACIEALEKNPDACGAYTDELLINTKGNTIRPGIWSGQEWNPLLQLEPRYLHHIYVMRRQFVEQHLHELEKWPNLAEFILKGLVAAHGPWIHVDRFGYKWRLHDDGPWHKKFPTMGLYAARWRIIPVLQKAASKYQAHLPPENG